MEPTKESFLEFISNCKDEACVDAACFEWLEMLCKDYGSEGVIVEKLLTLTKNILDVR